MIKGKAPGQLLSRVYMKPNKKGRGAACLRKPAGIVQVRDVQAGSCSVFPTGATPQPRFQV
jgi:hypothetical protein